jgi:hypothetical protein
MRHLILAVALAASPALAKENWGVKMPDTLEVGGKQLKLNGMGLRTKFIIRVYVAGLYVENPSKDAAKLISADEPKSVKLSFLMNLEKDKITEAITAGFEKNSKAQMPALKERLDKFNAAIKDLKKGDELSFTYVPATGTQVKAPGVDLTLPGKDFYDALLSTWLGKDPVHEGCKNGLLGND